MNYLLALLIAVCSLQAETITQVTKSNLEEVLSSEYVIIDVYANWCGPCRRFAPIFEEVASLEGQKYRFAKADIDTDEEVSTIYNVSTVPTILFIRNKEVLGRHTGLMTKDAFLKKIQDCFK
ncbi:MAG: thiol reductase thioredoxin [Chlamydiae bacterium]|nr:thiol reductase thioredoxin [Chlamydiota bacterium]